jgi:hypothetical protein
MSGFGPAPVHQSNPSSQLQTVENREVIESSLPVCVQSLGFPVFCPIPNRSAENFASGLGRGGTWGPLAAATHWRTNGLEPTSKGVRQSAVACGGVHCVTTAVLPPQQGSAMEDAHPFYTRFLGYDSESLAVFSCVVLRQ